MGYLNVAKIFICKIYFWCWSRKRSFTVFTGLKVVRGTSTKMVFQLLMAPFHKPGSSRALSERPPFDLDEMKPVDLSTYLGRSNFSPL